MNKYLQLINYWRKITSFRDVLVQRIISKNKHVKHNNINMTFFIPNTLCCYRATTFSSKEPETLEWIDSFEEGAIFWDIGANIGLYSIYAAKAKNAQVLGFEPSVFNLEFLAKNIYANNLQQKVKIFPLALSNKSDFNLFKMNNPIWGGALSAFGVDYNQTGGAFNASFEYNIAGLSADKAAEVFNMPQPNHIKIDVDGIEHLILSGSKKILTQVDTVMIEIDEGFNEQSKDSKKYLADAGLVLLEKYPIGRSNSQANQLWVRKN
jgi:FkbM family methyltransferase